MKILVTGSAGLIGSYIADELTKIGYDVVGVDNLSGGYIRNTRNHKFHLCDLRDKFATEVIVKAIQPTHVFHCAASAREIGSLFEPLKSTEDNYLSYMNLLNACIKVKFKKMILFSTMATYGAQQPPFNEDMQCMPEDVYAINKTAMELSTKCLSEIHDFKYTIVKPHNVFGIRQAFDLYRNVFAIWMNRIMHKEKQIYVFGDGEQKRAFSYITFSLPCYIKCLEDFTNSKTYNIGGIKAITLNEAAELTLQAMDVCGKVCIEHLPSRPREVKMAFSTYQKSIDELGYKEDIELLDCLKEMALWCKSLGPQQFLNEPLELENEKTPIVWRSKKNE
jgi:UDP-glucose 4-epimerase